MIPKKMLQDALKLSDFHDAALINKWDPVKKPGNLTIAYFELVDAGTESWYREFVGISFMAQVTTSLDHRRHIRRFEQVFPVRITKDGLFNRGLLIETKHLSLR